MPFKKIISLFSIATAAMVGLRTFELMFFVDSATGFIKKNHISAVGSTVCGVGIIFLIVGIYLLSYFGCRRQPTKLPTKENAPVMPFAAIIAAFYFVANGLMLKDVAFDTFTLLKCIFAAFSIGFMVYYIFTFTKGNKVPFFLVIAPTAFTFVKLLEVFFQTSSLATIGENIILIVLMCFVVLFFQLHAKILTKTTIRKSSRKILPIGLCAVALCCVYSLPPFIITALGRSTRLHEKTTAQNLSLILLSVYILAFVLSLYNIVKTKRKKLRYSGSGIMNAEITDLSYDAFIETKDYAKPEATIKIKDEYEEFYEKLANEEKKEKEEI